jgi:radical SAM protein with 4Fe4S-binding SPASM domain
LTDEARDVLLELELERLKVRTQALLDQARTDPTASYKELRWYPRYVVWELTLACNMRCGHCGSAAGKARDDELSLDEMLHACDELAELGCERLTLLGGEPLIHRHWQAVAARIQQDGFRCNVITNGWTLHHERVCDQIKEAGLTIVGISVDGYGESHDRLRRREGSFDRIMKGMALLQEREVPLAISTVITNDSLDDLPKMKALFRDLGVKVWQFQIGTPLGRMERDDPVLIKPHRLPELFEFITETFAEKGELRLDLSDNIGYFGTPRESWIGRHRPKHDRIWSGCSAGIQAMGLDSNGDVKGCQSLPSVPEFIEGNIRERPMAEIWNDPNGFRYTRGFATSMLGGYCAECDYGPLCKAGCTSGAYGFTGSVGDNPMCIHRFEITGE